jgi:hypothetical protein
MMEMTQTLRLRADAMGRGCDAPDGGRTGRPKRMAHRPISRFRSLGRVWGRQHATINFTKFEGLNLLRAIELLQA